MQQDYLATLHLYCWPYPRNFRLETLMASRQYVSRTEVLLRRQLVVRWIIAVRCNCAATAKLNQINAEEG